MPRSYLVKSCFFRALILYLQEVRLFAIVNGETNIRCHEASFSSKIEYSYTQVKAICFTEQTKCRLLRIPSIAYRFLIEALKYCAFKTFHGALSANISEV